MRVDLCRLRRRQPGINPLPGADTATLEGAIRRYDGEIRYLDAVLGDLFRHLRTMGLYEQATIVLVADHGEEFGERGGLYHGGTLHEEIIRVPLLVKFPGNRWGGTRVAGVVSSRSTSRRPSRRVLGWRTPPELDGRSVVDLVAGGGAAREAVFSFHTARLQGRSQAYAVVTQGAKLIEEVRPEHKLRFFDLEKDPRELEPIPGDQRAAELRRLLIARLAVRGGEWHARVCGGGENQLVTLAIDAIDGRPDSIDLEDDDSLTLDEHTGRAVLTAAVGRSRGDPARRRQGPADDDEIAFRGGVSTLEISVQPRDTVVRTMIAGAAAPSAPSDRHSLILDAGASTGSRAAPPRCEAFEEAVVLLWHVDEHAAETVQADEATIERLRALGYVDE